MKSPIVKSLKFISTATVLCTAFMSLQAIAGKPSKADAGALAGYGDIIMPELLDGSVMIDNDKIRPGEPNILQTKFLKIDKPNGLQERIDRLIFGIERDIPPEYDHYGHEIRRFMAHVGNEKIYSDESYLTEQIKNVRKARVVLRYWQAHVDEEIGDIDKLIEQEDSGSSVRSIFKQNKATIRGFFIAAQGWLESNEALLMNIFDTFGYFQLDYPELIFTRPHERIEYFNLFQARQAKLKEIRSYQSFTMMVY